MSELPSYGATPRVRLPSAKVRQTKAQTIETRESDDVSGFVAPKVVDHKRKGAKVGPVALAHVRPRKLTDREWQIIKHHWPETDPGQLPAGHNILVQLRIPQKKSEGGIILPDETQEGIKWNEMTARVIALGPLAYRDRKTTDPFPEGPWCQPGDFVRVPRYGGDRSEAEIDKNATALFVVFQDTAVISVVTGNPLTFRTSL